MADTILAGNLLPLWPGLSYLNLKSSKGEGLGETSCAVFPDPSLLSKKQGENDGKVNNL